MPTGVKIFNWIAHHVGRLDPLHHLHAVRHRFPVQFVIGGLSGVTFAVVPIDWQITDTYYVVAHFHYVLFGGTLFGVMAGVYYWFPKMSGRMLSERLGSLNFWLMVIGFNLTFFIQHFLGLVGMPRRVYTYPDLPGWGVLNMVSTVGAFMLGSRVLVLLANIVSSLRHGHPAGDNPWNAWTLEWATTSPPPHTISTGSARPRPAPALGSCPRWQLMKRFETIRLAMAVFIASEAVFFAFLIGVYVYYYGAVVHGPNAGNSLNPPRTLIFTICLLASSATLLFAERQLARARKQAFRIWLAATILLGAAFLAGQGIEYAGLIRRSITPERNLFGASFFTLTGFHGFHVLCGLVSLTILLLLTFRRSFGPKQISGVGAVAMYWHFVDAVWIAIFSLVYLTVWL